jgi:hypothetical protein
MFETLGIEKKNYAGRKTLPASIKEKETLAWSAGEFPPPNTKSSTLGALPTYTVQLKRAGHHEFIYFDDQSCPVLNCWWSDDHHRAYSNEAEQEAGKLAALFTILLFSTPLHPLNSLTALHMVSDDSQACQLVHVSTHRQPCNSPPACAHLPLPNHCKQGSSPRVPAGGIPAVGTDVHTRDMHVVWQ